MNLHATPEHATDAPRCIPAEEALLGTMLSDTDTARLLAKSLESDDFHVPVHQLIHAVVREYLEKDYPLGVDTVADWFIQRGLGYKVEEGAYLTRLVASGPSVDMAVAHAETVRECAALRKVHRIARRMLEGSLQQDGCTAVEVLAAAQQELAAIGEDARRPDVRGLRMILGDCFDVLRQRYVGSNPVTGLSTGYAGIDEVTCGLHPGELVVVGGRPAMGKTALVLNIAEHAALKVGKTVAIFSTDMWATQVGLRLISSVGRVENSRLRCGQLEDADWTRISGSIRQMKDAVVLVGDTPLLSPEALRATARGIKRKHGLGLVIIDDLQAMAWAELDASKGDGFAVQSLKLLAKELDVPVVVVSRLNRLPEKRQDKRPLLSDLRGSGAIEDEADLVLLLYRDDYYDKESPDKGLAEVNIAKNRHGPVGRVVFRFCGRFYRFDDLEGRSVPGG